jgi:hypothetical protein
MLRSIPVQQNACSVGRAVVNDDPLDGQYRLAKDTFEGGLDVLFFVPHRSNDYISRHAN